MPSNPVAALNRRFHRNSGALSQSKVKERDSTRLLLSGARVRFLALSCCAGRQQLRCADLMNYQDSNDSGRQRFRPEIWRVSCRVKGFFVLAVLMGVSQIAVAQQPFAPPIKRIDTAHGAPRRSPQLVLPEQLAPPQEA